LWFNIAAMASAFVGGELVARLSPAGALHTAAAIIAVAPFAAIFGALFLIDEAPSRLDLAELKSTFRGFLATFKMKELWVIGAFLFLYYLNPGFGLPLYYYMTDTLKFSQAYIGILGAINAAGWIAGALVYRKFGGGLSSKQMLNLSILVGVVTTAAFLLLAGEASAAIINFFSGAAGMIAFVATLSLAADYCPKRAEGFAFAALMSFLNLSSAASNNIGSFLYERAFNSRLAPLIVVSTASTAAIFLLVPLLRLGAKQPGEPGGAAAGQAEPGTVPVGSPSQ
ncbi:MAG: MFS transporter, partial [Stellaceae bacterium]